VSLAACGEPEVVVPNVLQVVAILPNHGATDIGTAVEGRVYFSHQLKSAVAASTRVALTCLGTPPCNTPVQSGCGSVAEVPADISFEVDQVAHLAPADPLGVNLCYRLSVTAGIEAADADVGPLGVTVLSDFQTTP